ncbi:MAG: MFS transporter [Alphaproteobacteria bacterium]|nr:MFS transporter [Alphaproteobacteria bacterium]
MEQGKVSRRWTTLLPVIFVTYSLAYLDRANFSFGAAAGMARDLNITGDQSSLLGALFFLGYFLFQIPGAIYAQRHSVKKLIFAGLIGWGVLASAMGVISNIHLLYVARFLLGVVESAVLPALLILQARWYTRSERARANALLVIGNPATLLWMSVLSGYLASGLGWRMMFIIEGLPPIIWAFVWWRLVSDHPRDARWLEQGERTALEAALTREQGTIAPVKNYAAAFRSPRVLWLSAQYFLWSVGVYGFVIWLPSILRMGQTSMIEIGWLSAVPYLVCIFAEYGVSAWSDRIGRRKIAIWPPLLIGALAFYGSYLMGPDHFWAGFVLLVIAAGAMYAPYGPFFAYIADSLPSNVAGGAIALINSMGALGSFAGSYAVGLLNDATGNAGMSFLLMAGALAISSAITVFLPENRAG